MKLKKEAASIQGLAMTSGDETNVVSWGSSQFIREARLVNLQELQQGKGNSANDHLVPPDGLTDCYKVFKADDLVVALTN
jgi:hypothetical protein